MPKISINNTHKQKATFEKRANAIATAIERDTLKTREEAQALLKETSQPISTTGIGFALRNYPIGAFEGHSNALAIQIERLEEHAKTLPTEKQYKINEQEKEAQKSISKAVELIRGKIKQFNDNIAQLDDSNGFKATAKELEANLNQVVEDYSTKQPLTKETLPQIVDKIAEEIQTSQPGFDPKSWHKFADIALTFINALKAIVSGVEGANRFKLFSERGDEARAVNQLMDNLKTEVSNYQPDSEESYGAHGQK